MFDGAFLLKPGYPCCWRLSKESAIKSFWPVLLWLIFFHQRCRLKTRSVSPSEVACRAVNWKGSRSSFEGGSSGTEAGSASGVPRSPSRIEVDPLLGGTQTWKLSHWRNIKRDEKERKDTLYVYILSIPYNHLFVK